MIKIVSNFELILNFTVTCNRDSLKSLKNLKFHTIKCATKDLCAFFSDSTQIRFFYFLVETFPSFLVHFGNLIENGTCFAFIVDAKIKKNIVLIIFLK